jgi:hypothetical protein
MSDDAPSLAGCAMTIALLETLLRKNILTREEISDTLQRAERYVSILGVGPETHGASSLVWFCQGSRQPVSPDLE